LLSGKPAKPGKVREFSQAGKFGGKSRNYWNFDYRQGVPENYGWGMYLECNVI